ncbi:hypothetical protein C8J56DRAFT_787574, partial [Mycena floridula]
RPILLQQNQRVMGASPSERHVLQRIARTDSSLGLFKFYLGTAAKFSLFSY